jgi:FAD/FMN-containing dehydrogenase
MLIANLAARLEGVLGAGRVTASEEALSSFAVDGISPAAVVRPTAAEEVAEVVRHCLRHDRTVPDRPL